MQTIQEILAKSPYLKQMSTKEVLDSYRHIELSEEEMDQAVLSAKIKKEALILEEQKQAAISERRKSLIDEKWSYEQTRGYALYRAGGIYKGEFQLDVNNEFVFDMLCHYFSNSPMFVQMAKEAGVNCPSLEKGILLAGNPGTGKTWMMKLFSKNKKQVFHIHNLKVISEEYQKNGVDALDVYIKRVKNAVNDSASFYQKYSGLCLDDIGTEDPKNNYGNKVKVGGDIIEERYALIEEGEQKSNVGVFLHGTTNFTGPQFSEYYGPRVASRMREIFNYIELPGNDRRK